VGGRRIPFERVMSDGADMLNEVASVPGSRSDSTFARATTTAAGSAPAGTSRSPRTCFRV
jgi:hypothetical protein